VALKMVSSKAHAAERTCANCNLELAKCDSRCLLISWKTSLINETDTPKHTRNSSKSVACQKQLSTHKELITTSTTWKSGLRVTSMQQFLDHSTDLVNHFFLLCPPMGFSSTVQGLRVRSSPYIRSVFNFYRVRNFWQHIRASALEKQNGLYSSFDSGEYQSRWSSF
jgi:hypothetical protein